MRALAELLIFCLCSSSAMSGALSASARNPEVEPNKRSRAYGAVPPRPGTGRGPRRPADRRRNERARLVQVFERGSWCAPNETRRNGSVRRMFRSARSSTIEHAGKQERPRRPVAMPASVSLGKWTASSRQRRIQRPIDRVATSTRATETSVRSIVIASVK